MLLTASIGGGFLIVHCPNDYNLVICICMESIDTKSLSDLSHIGIAPDEEVALKEKLQSMIAYVGVLQTAEAVSDVSVRDPLVSHELRADEVKSLGADARNIVIRNFPDSVGDLLKVPEVL